MIAVKSFKSELFTSNVFTVTASENSEAVVLIDCGAYLPVLNSLRADQHVSAILLTHYHYDHIYFIQQWINVFPELLIFGSEETLLGLKSAKRNLSFYHEDPIEFTPLNYKKVQEADGKLFIDDLAFDVLDTPGHCEGSLSYKMDNFIFTGDAIIPPIPVVTKLRTGNKELAKASVRKIQESGNSDTLVCPGHEACTYFHQVNWSSYLNL